MLDHSTREQLENSQELLFSSCTELQEQGLNVSSKRLSVLTAYIVLYYPQLKALGPTAPVVIRMEECLDAAGNQIADLISWSVTFIREAAEPNPEHAEHQEKPDACQYCHLSVVVEQLITMN